MERPCTGEKLPGTRFPTLQKERTTPILTEQKVVGRQTEIVHNNYNSLVALYSDVRISSDVTARGQNDILANGLS